MPISASAITREHVHHIVYLQERPGASFEARRDTAYIRLLVDSGPRAGEITPLTLDDLDFEADVAQVMIFWRLGRKRP